MGVNVKNDAHLRPNTGSQRESVLRRPRLAIRRGFDQQVVVPRQTDPRRVVRLFPVVHAGRMPSRPPSWKNKVRKFITRSLLSLPIHSLFHIHTRLTYKYKVYYGNEPRCTDQSAAAPAKTQTNNGGAILTQNNHGQSPPNRVSGIQTPVNGASVPSLSASINPSTPSVPASRSPQGPTGAALSASVHPGPRNHIHLASTGTVQNIGQSLRAVTHLHTTRPTAARTSPRPVAVPSLTAVIQPQRLWNLAVVFFYIFDIFPTFIELPL